MATAFLTNLDENEFKAFLKEALQEIMGDAISKQVESLPEILDVKQAAKFLRLKLTTLYEKTSRKLVPHFKKGNKLYFHYSELKQWIKEGKVKTSAEIEGEATTYTLTTKK